MLKTQALLISLTPKKAGEEGFNALSLIALADVTDAHRLYYRCGFEVVSTIEMAPHELIPHEGGNLESKQNRFLIQSSYY